MVQMLGLIREKFERVYSIDSALYADACPVTQGFNRSLSSCICIFPSSPESGSLPGNGERRRIQNGIDIAE